MKMDDLLAMKRNMDEVDSPLKGRVAQVTPAQMVSLIRDMRDTFMPHTDSWRNMEDMAQRVEMGQYQDLMDTPPLIYGISVELYLPDESPYVQINRKLH